MHKHAFIIGAQRSGSSYLARTLATSPALRFAEPFFPEPKFFLDPSKFQQGPDYYLQNYFRQEAVGAVRVEKSTSYLESPEAAKRIGEWFPDATIVVVLRNPIYRAVSNYFFSKANGIETLDIEDAFRMEADRLQQGGYTSSVSPFAYVQRGHYVKDLEAWGDRFPASQIKILLFEDMISSKKPIAELVEVLGGDRNEIVFPATRINEGNYPAGEFVPESLIQRMGDVFRATVLELDARWAVGAAERWGF